MPKQLNLALKCIGTPVALPEEVEQKTIELLSLLLLEIIEGEKAEGRDEQDNG